MRPNTWESFYDSNAQLYARVADIAEILLRQQLDKEGTKYLSLSSRLKEKPSYLQKIKRKAYRSPGMITDLAGVRVVTYLPSQVESVCEVIRRFFDIDEKNTLDKSSDLGTDKVGYQSRHFVCSLGRRRARLPEYKGVHDLKFEIQVRTILQHAWADLAHGKSYKFSGRLPSDLQRRLNLHAGNLELVDIGLDELSSSIDSYSESIVSDASKMIAQEVNAISLRDYISNNYENIVVDGISESSIDDLVDEVRKFGISTIGELDELVDQRTKDFIERGNITIMGAVRAILFVTDVDKYLKTSWNRNWGHIEDYMYEFLISKYSRQKIARLAKKYDFDIDTGVKGG